MLFSLLALFLQVFPIFSAVYDDVSFLEAYFIRKEGDIIAYNVTRIPGMMSTALRDEDARWEDGEVPVYLSPSFTSWEKDKIVDAILHIHDTTCVRFRRVKEDDDDFLMIVKPKRKNECASMVGKQGGAQALFLSSDCFTRKIILHELMHALGFIHEHNRSDRDKFVTVRWSNIKDGEEHNFDKRRSGTLSLMETPYAYDSIMHYEGTEFSYNKRSPTLVPNGRVRKMGGDESLSPIDVERINKYYGCTIKGEEVKLEEEEEEAEVEMERTTTSTTEAPTTTEAVRTTMFAPIHWRRNNCPNPYEIPEAGGHCRWLIMKVAKDPDSPRHYLHCLPSLKTSDIRCGEWKRKQCAPKTVFDPIYRSCRPGYVLEEDDSEEEV